MAILIAASLTVPVFAAIHIPIRLHNGFTGDALIANLVRIAIWGFVFTFLFASTRNLWLVIGIHALTNRRCLWVQPETELRPFELLICLLMIFGFTLLKTWQARRENQNATSSGS